MQMLFGPFFQAWIVIQREGKEKVLAPGCPQISRSPRLFL